MFKTLSVRTASFQRSFFPFCVSQWNTLDTKIKTLPTVSSFKSAILKFIRPQPNSTYNVHHHSGIVLLNRLKVGFSHLSEHKFRHNFIDTNDHFCNCRTNEIEATEHYLLHCPNYSIQRKILHDNLRLKGISLLPFKAPYLVKLLLFGDINFDDNINNVILTNVITFITSFSAIKRIPVGNPLVSSYFIPFSLLYIIWPYPWRVCLAGLRPFSRVFSFVNVFVMAIKEN